MIECQMRGVMDDHEDTGSEVPSAKPGAPNMARLYRVAAGLASWTPAELAWLDQNPEYKEYEQRIRDAVADRSVSVDRSSGGHVNRIKDKWPRKDPPSIG